MLNQPKSKWILAFCLFLSLLLACQRFSLTNEQVILQEEAYYEIDTDTILADIERGTAGVFSTQISTPSPPLSQSLSIVQWTQEDYLDIVGALYKSVWKQSIEDWGIRHILFSMKCEDVRQGPQFGHFILYKIDQFQGQETRLERQIYIDPSNNSVSWVEVGYSPSLLKMSPIPLSEYRISVAEALQIAEDNGGLDIRTETSNRCAIDGELTTVSDKWRISYGQTLDLFTIKIDAHTGEPGTANFEMK